MTISIPDRMDRGNESLSDLYSGLIDLARIANGVAVPVEIMDKYNIQRLEDLPASSFADFMDDIVAAIAFHEERKRTDPYYDKTYGSDKADNGSDGEE